MPQSDKEKCATCAKIIPKNHLRCGNCKAVYDLECLKISTQRYYSVYMHDKQRRDNWTCQGCLTKQPKSGNQSTPCSPSLVSVDSNQGNNVTLRTKVTPDGRSDTSFECEYVDGRPSIPAEYMHDLKELCKELKAARAEMANFRSTIADLSATIKIQNDRIEALEKRIEVLESTRNNESSVNISKLEDTIAHLKNDIIERDQDLLSNDLEIASLPESMNENPVHVILTVTSKLGVEINERDIVSARRVGPPRAAAADGAAPRPRPLVVRLARRSLRDAVLQAARVRRRLTTEGLDLQGAVTRPFYINERLSPHHRHLFQKAHETARRMAWKYVWTRDGRIFVRQNNGKERHRLRNEADLVRVFGDDNVGESK